MKALIDRLGASVVRTVTPLLVGFVVVLLAKIGFQWTPSAEALLVAAQIVTAAYYFLVRLFEEYVSPKFGVLLGKVGSPEYGL